MPINFDALSKTELEAMVANSATQPGDVVKAQAELAWISDVEEWWDGVTDNESRTLGQIIGMFAAGPRRGFIIPPPPPVH